MVQFSLKTKTPLVGGGEDREVAVSESPKAQAVTKSGSGNALNMYLNPMVYGSIPTEDKKNSTGEGGGESREVAVPGAPKTRVVTFLVPIYLGGLPKIVPTFF
jgi:hypothetical protein